MMILSCCETICSQQVTREEAIAVAQTELLYNKGGCSCCGGFENPPQRTSFL